MREIDLPLFNWQPKRQIIPFPAKRREGHARKVAMQLAKARTQKAAANALNRSLERLCVQLQKAGVPDSDIAMEHDAFLHLIFKHCVALDSPWKPDLETASFDKSEWGARLTQKAGASPFTDQAHNQKRNSDDT